MTNFTSAKSAVVLAASFVGKAIAHDANAVAQETLVGVTATAYGVAITADKAYDMGSKVIAHADAKMATLAGKLGGLTEKLAKINADNAAKRAAKVVSFGNKAAA